MMKVVREQGLIPVTNASVLLSLVWASHRLSPERQSMMVDAAVAARRKIIGGNADRRARGTGSAEHASDVQQLFPNGNIHWRLAFGGEALRPAAVQRAMAPD